MSPEVLADIRRRDALFWPDKAPNVTPGALWAFQDRRALLAEVDRLRTLATAHGFADILAAGTVAVVSRVGTGGEG